MERTQRDLVCFLLDHIRSLGLISDFTYSQAVDLVHSGIDLPEFFRCVPAKGAMVYERAQNPQ